MNFPTVALGEVADLARDGIAPHYIKTGTLFVGLENIKKGGGFEGVSPVDEGELASTKFAFTPKHVLYGKLRPYLAKIALPEFEGVCSTDIIPILPGPRLDRRFLAHYLLTPKMIALASDRAAGANLPRLSPKVLLEFPIPLPPIEEQRWIAAMLDKAEELRAKRRAALALLDQLPQAIFLEMFGDPATNPKKWPWVPIQALVQNITNWNPAKLSGEFQYVDISSIDSESKEIVGIRQIVAADAPSRARQRIQSGDVLVSTVRPNLNAVALVREIDDTGTASTGFCVLRPQTKRAVSSYLFNWVRSKPFIESMVRQATGASYPAVTDRIVKAFEVFDVPLELQQHFAARAEAIHRTKAVHQSALAELDALFTSLQWSAFSGDCG